jgi:mannan endo-1,4-beta-mannosidase
VTEWNSTSGTQWSGYQRRSWLRDHAGLAAGIAIVIVVALGVVGLKISGTLLSSRPSAASAPSQHIAYLGVFEPGAPGTYSGVEQFAHAVGRQPNLVSYYSGWSEKFQEAFAQSAARHGATVIVQMDPTNVSVAHIADGMYDSYLTSYADAVAAFKHKVIISFGHEMNGFWETWGYRHTPPKTFIAAWRHIVTLFRQQGANNVTWLWQVNSLSSQTGAPSDWWPGPQYVNWVGVSGYYYLPGDTFDNVFNPVVTAVRQFTQDPVLIAETAVGPQAGQSRGIKDLFAGLRMQHDIGLVWFDQHSTGGLYKGEDWRLEGNRDALSAFRSALKG